LKAQAEGAKPFKPSVSETSGLPVRASTLE
jgi:hypothetical protein